MSRTTSRESFFQRTAYGAAAIFCEALAIAATVPLITDAITQGELGLTLSTKFGLLVGGIGLLILSAAAKEQDKKKGDPGSVWIVTAVGVLLSIVGVVLLIPPCG